MKYIVLALEEDFGEDDLHVFVIYGKDNEDEAEKDEEEERSESF